MVLYSHTVLDSMVNIERQHFEDELVVSSMTAESDFVEFVVAVVRDEELENCCEI